MREKGPLVHEAYLLHEHCVVALKGLEDVVITTESTQAVDGCIAVTPARLPANVQSVGGEGCGICLQACTQGMHFLHQPVAQEQGHLISIQHIHAVENSTA